MTKRILLLIAIPATVVALLAACSDAETSAPADNPIYYDRYTGSLIAVTPTEVEVLHPSPRDMTVRYQIGPIPDTLEATITLEDDWQESSEILQIYFLNQRGSYDLWVADYLNNSRKYLIYADSYHLEKKELTPDDLRSLARERTQDNVYAFDSLIPAPKEAADLLDQLTDARPLESIALVEVLISQYPDDLFFNLLRLDLLAENQEEVALSKAMEQFAEKFTTDKEDIAHYAVTVHRENIRYFESLNNGTNAYARVADPYGKLSTEEQSQAFLDYNEVPNFQRGTQLALTAEVKAQLPNFLAAQTFAKIQRVFADFSLMSGYPDEARDLTFHNSRMAIGMMESRDMLIKHLIGVAILSIATQTNANLYVDGYTDANELERAFPPLKTIHDETIRALRMPMLAYHPVVNRTGEQGLSLEVQTRGKTALSRVALTATAASIRHYQLQSGNWPTTPSAGILLEKALTDPFSAEGLPLRIANAGDDKIVYSIGPDQEDNGGSPEYDPTNGTLSIGDLTLSIFRDRKYRFPTEPIRPRNRAEFLTRYPNGVLPDPFADTRGRSYIISDTVPPVLWSVGPDVDESEYRSWNTNSGNLTADHGAASTLEGQWMHFVNEPQQATYDPTNGTVSDGNIYWSF